MSTWHQDRALAARARPLWHETLWTVVNDKPGQMMTLARFETREQADKYAKNTGGYVLPPSKGK
jgi:hypothetical protein